MRRIIFENHFYSSEMAIKQKQPLPGSGDFVRGLDFHESSKDTLMKLIIFMRMM